MQPENSHTNTLNPHLLRWVILSAIAISVLVLFAWPEQTDSELAGVFRVSILAAFFGGVFSLLSPCSAVLLPAFFAYSFKEKTQLVRMTFIFWLGLASIFVPLGFSAGFLSKFLLQDRLEIYYGAGIIFMFIGIWSLTGRQLTFRFQRESSGQGRGAGVVFVSGLLFAFATGTCTAPILGGILTLATVQSGVLPAVGLLLVYSLGLVAPLLLIAWFFDRNKFGQSSLVRGKELRWRIGKWKFTTHTSKLVVGVLFITIGILFIFTRGTNTLFNSFGLSGLATTYYNINSWLLTNTRGWGTWVVVGGVVIAIVMRWIFARRGKSA